MPKTVTSQGRLAAFVSGPIADFLKEQGFAKAGRVFRRVAPNDDLLVISFMIDSSGRYLEGETVFVVEVSVMPPLFLKFSSDKLDITPPRKPGTMYGMWRSCIRPAAIPTDPEGKPLWPYMAFRFMPGTDEATCRDAVLEQLKPGLDFMGQLLDHSFWLELVDGWHKEMSYPSLWGPRAQTILLLPLGPSDALLSALQECEKIGDCFTVDWSILEMKAGGYDVPDYEAIRGQRASGAPQA